MSQYQPSDADREKFPNAPSGPRLESDTEIMGRKLTEVKAGQGGPKFMKELKKEEPRVPVHVTETPAGYARRGQHPLHTPGKKEVGEGHHRLAYLMEVAPDRPLNVVHHVNMAQLGDYMADATVDNPDVFDPRDFG